MTDSLQTRLDRLEALYAEQDYTIQSLNQTVARQDREILSLNRSVDRLQRQLTELKADFGDDINPRDEKPPHY